MAKLKKVPDEKVKPGMIVTLKECPGEKWEVVEVRGKEKVLVRREDLEKRDCDFRPDINGFCQICGQSGDRHVH